jgi:glycerol uptake facilitator-like aquaporin
MFARVLIDALGTFILVLSVFVSGGNSLVIGTTLAAIVFLIGGISGAYVNPAISLAGYIYGSLSFNEFIAYSVGHFIAAVCAVKAYSYYTRK